MFTHEELVNFFRATDEVEYNENCRIPYPRFQSKLKALTIPVIYRLMFSSGIRPNEARGLQSQNVDLGREIIYLRTVKGYTERLVALHPSMAAILRQYDALISKEIPNRKTFFPNAKDEPYSATFLATRFKECWYKYNEHGEQDVVPYSLRHNYAVENIMSWDNDSENVEQKMLVLSKSMGHSRIADTMYYFHLVPRFADLLDACALTLDNDV